MNRFRSRWFLSVLTLALAVPAAGGAEEFSNAGAEGPAEENDQTQTAGQRSGDAGGHAQPSPQHRRDEAQGQQPIGVAQDALTLRLVQAQPVTARSAQGGDAFVHGSDLLCKLP